MHPGQSGGGNGHSPATRVLQPRPTKESRGHPGPGGTDPRSYGRRHRLSTTRVSPQHPSGSSLALPFLCSPEGDRTPPAPSPQTSVSATKTTRPPEPPPKPQTHLVSPELARVTARLHAPSTTLSVLENPHGTAFPEGCKPWDTNTALQPQQRRSEPTATEQPPPKTSHHPPGGAAPLWAAGGGGAGRPSPENRGPCAPRPAQLSPAPPLSPPCTAVPSAPSPPAPHSCPQHSRSLCSGCSSPGPDPHRPWRGAMSGGLVAALETPVETLSGDQELPFTPT